MESLTKDVIVRELRRIGLKEGDLLLLHSSFSSLGHVEGGPETMIASLMEVLGQKGALLMPSWQKGGEYALLRQGCTFDLRTSPSEMGLLTEIFRCRKGVIRSLSPTHCLAGTGGHAETLLDGHQFCRVSVGCGSPFEKFVRKNGKIMLLGVTHSSNTMLHFVENTNGAPTICRELFSPLVIDLEGRSWVVPTHPHMPGLRRRYEHVEDELLRAKIQVNDTIGTATVRLIQAAPMVDMIGSNLRKNPLYLCEVFSGKESGVL